MQLLSQLTQINYTNAKTLRWLNTVLRAVSGNSCEGECFKQTQRRKSNGKKKTISQNLLIKNFVIFGRIFNFIVF